MALFWSKATPNWKWRKSGKKLLFSTFSAGGNFSKAFLSKLKSICYKSKAAWEKMHFQIKGLKRHRQCCYVPFNKKLSLLLLEASFFIIAFDQNRQTWVRTEPKLYSVIWRFLAFYKYFQKVVPLDLLFWNSPFYLITFFNNRTDFVVFEIL